MLVEFILFLANTITQDSIGLSIIILSFTVNLICLPIYNVAEKWQQKERAIQKRMKKRVDDIKAVFKGDERYMILSTYYRQNNYHPVYALRSSFALFIQIPFFIAAYSLLSHLPSLNGASFLFLRDLGKPDALLKVAGLSINILPVVMTTINLISSYIYVRGFPLKDKLQLYIMSALFLILLYNSPAGLVFYWTLNNLFSLCKNIFYKVKLNRKTWYFISTILSILFTILVITQTSNKKSIAIVLAITFLILILPFIKKLNAFLQNKETNKIFNNTKNINKIFITSLISFWALTGLLIPAMTIASSPLEFINPQNISNPLSIILSAVIQSVGCAFWMFCLFKLFQDKTKKYFSFISICILTISIINVFILPGNYGDISNLFIFENQALLRHNLNFLLYSLFIIVLSLSLSLVFIYTKLSKFTPHILNIILITTIMLGTYNVISIQKEYSNYDINNLNKNKEQKAYRVSKTGKNIFILMLDRSMNFFIPEIFENSEIVKNEYEGFTLFKNTIAYGNFTYKSTPSLFGGYEYTPENLNKRKNERLVDKHNEALSVLPRLFSENDWNVSFTDPSWLNYSWVPDLSIFNKYNMRSQNIDGTGKYSSKFLTEKKIISNDNRSQYKPHGIKKNVVYFSFFKILPPEIRRLFYNDGKYTDVDIPNLMQSFVNAYSALDNLSEEVEFVDNKNCINIIVNNLPHEPPSKELIKSLNLKSDILSPLAKNFCLNKYTEDHYYANFYAHELCAKFFKFLKENNCYNNSRIIIMGDHGRHNIKTKNMKFLDAFDENIYSPEDLIPLLMMKDFNQKGALKINEDFMTLADTPILTTKDLNPKLQKNPFSGKRFSETQNKSLVKAISGTGSQEKKPRKAKQFKTTQKDWVYVKENVYDPKCWSKDNFGKEK